jgi:hypothetical protein
MTRIENAYDAMTDTDLHALAFFPADHAVVERGKVYVHGGFWDKLQFPNYPQVFSISLVAVLKVPFRAYHQDHRFEVGLEDADGNAQTLRIQGEFRVGTDPQMRTGDPTVMPVAVSVSNLSIERPGDYAFVLSVDGSELARFQVRAVQITPPVQYASPPATEPPNPEEGP